MQKKLKALKGLEKKEQNFARSYNHFVSKEIIEFALKYRAASIKIEMLEGYGDNRKHAFILRNWSYFELQQMIEYKAARVGIAVLKIDPYHTSQTCSVCGHYEENQRNDYQFECKSCGQKSEADYNAALNIAKSNAIVTKKEECQYYKLHGNGNNPA